mmetsp:Transcript_27565/g.40711  ORF Transcript_27565/g.40711 Transcript_27565/m.40711 type:complete len:231 (+) Transcript_27565:59-751(+)
MDAVVAYNNQGVYFYEIGVLEQANACFRNAARGVRSIRERWKLSNRTASKSAHNYYDPIKGWSAPPRTAPLQEGYSVMFIRALILNDFDFSLMMPSNEDIDALALVVLYNSAALNHCYSDSRGQITTSTDAAHHGYEQTYIMAKKLNGKISSRFSFHLKVLEMSICNNMGVLYHNNFGRFRDAAQCFKSSRKQMELIEKQLICSGSVTAEELQQLSLNILVVPVATTPVA